MEIKEIVNSLVRKYKTNNPFEICSYKDIDIHYVPLGSLDGFYTENFRIKTIYINENLNHRQREIVCSHELGHITLRHNANKLFLSNNTFLVTNKYEIQADKFAAELLTHGIDLNDFEGYSIDQFSAALDLPVKLIKLKFNI